MIASVRRSVTLLSLLACSAAVASAQTHADSIKAALGAGIVRQGTFQVNWSPDGGILEGSRDANGLVLTSVNAETGAKTPFLPDSVSRALIEQYNKLSGKTAAGLPFTSLSWGRKGRVLILGTEDGTPYVFDRDTRLLRKIVRPKFAPTDADALMRDMAGSQLANGTYSPDYTHLGFIRGYDLYVANTTTGEETAITKGGSDSLMSGRPDWVYPEELNQTEAFFWSPDGRKIAYLQFDERPVVPFKIEHEPGKPVEWQRYPRAGANNPIVKLFIVDLATKKTVQVATKSSSNVYIIRPNWTPDGSELLFQRLNRRQDTLELLAANPKTGAVRRVLIEHDAAYVNVDGGSPGFGATPEPIRFLQDGKRFFWPSERSGWRNWYIYNLAGKQIAQVTSGERVFNDILAVDEQRGVMFTTAATNEAQETHLFRASLKGGNVTQVTQTPGVHGISMDPVGQYYVDVFSSPSQPHTANLFHTEKAAPLRQIGSVSYDFKGMQVYAPERLVVKAADGKTNLHGILYKPVGFDSTKKYPLLVQVYGGPQAQTVSGSHTMVDGNQMLAQDGYMVWAVDNRGTPNRGRDFERATYQQFGQADLDDQAAAVRAVIATHPYIDSTRVGISGTSFGGYMSAMAVLRYPTLFLAGTAMSAVTDWREYDSIYTERYMRTPQDNLVGYNKGSTFTYVNNLTGHLMILHGTSDNNVHVANATMLRDSLTKAGKTFEFKLYPEYRHGVPTDLAQAFLAKYLRPGAE